MTHIIAIMNTNISAMKLFVKKLLFKNSISNSSIPCLSFKSKISYHAYIELYILLMSVGADSNISLNVLLLRKTGRVNSEVVLLVSIGAFNSSVILN